MVWIHVTKKRIALVVALALIASIAYCARGVDRVAVIAGHGYIIPSQYPGSAYRRSSTPLTSFSTRVMWPNMEPWTREEAQRQRQSGQRAYGNCETLNISFSEDINVGKNRMDDSVLINYKNSYIEKKIKSEDFGMEIRIFSPKGISVPLYDSVYTEKIKDDMGFVAECDKIGSYPSPQCAMSFSVNEKKLHVQVNGGLSCIEHRQVITAKIIDMIDRFSGLYKYYH